MVRELSAPECQVLLLGPGIRGKELFKLALLELLARGWLELVEVRESSFLGLPKPSTYSLRSIPRRDAPPNRPLAAVFDLYGYAPSERFALARPVAEFAQRAHDRYSSFDGYARTEVLPYLAARGLLERRDIRALGIFPVTRWRRSRAGENARARLESILRLPPAQFNHWLERDPSRARAFLDEAGPALLLAAPLHPELKRLGDRLAHDDAFLDFDLDLGNLDLNVFDGLGDALSDLDAGVTGGDGDGGGGNGGGGD